MPGKFYVFLIMLLLSSSTIAENQILSFPSLSGYNAYQVKMTPDGRYIVFVSNTNNLQAGDQNNLADVYLYDTQTQHIEWISKEAHNLNLGGQSIYPSISDDGRYISYQSTALNLTQDSFPEELANSDLTQYSSRYYHVYLFDRVLNKTILVSSNDYNENNQYSSVAPKISGNGQTIAYVRLESSPNSNQNRAQGSLHIYQMGNQSHQVVDTHACYADSGEIRFPDITYDGDTIVYMKGSLTTDQEPGLFWTAETYVENSDASICTYQISTQHHTLIYTQNDETYGDIYNYNLLSSHPHISADGRYITFETYTANLGYGTDSLIGSIQLAAVYLHDQLTSNRTLIYRETNSLAWYTYDSLGSRGPQMEALLGFSAYISGNNKYILLTGANSLDIGDQNQLSDILLYSIAEKTIQRVSFNADGGSFYTASIAADIGHNESSILGITGASARSGNGYQFYNILLNNNQQQNHYPYVSSYSLHNDDDLTIQYQSTPPGYQQTVGLQMPNLDIFLINQENQLIPYTGNNLQQGRHQNTDKIVLTINDNFPAGSYHVLSILSPGSQNTLLPITKIARTRISINEHQRAPLQTDIFGEPQCHSLMAKNDGHFIDYDDDYQNILFSTTHNIENTMDNNHSTDLYVCNNETGLIKLVSINELNEIFPDETYFYDSLISANGNWVVFSIRNKLYLHNVSTSITKKLTIASEENCYPYNINISSNGQHVFFTCSNYSENTNKAFLWEASTDDLLEINRASGNNLQIASIPSIFVSSSENIIAFSAYSANTDKTNIYFYDVSDQQLTLAEVNLEQTSSDNQELSTTQYYNQTLNISDNDQIVLFKHYISRNTISGYYFAFYDRESRQSQLLKIDEEDHYLKTYNTRQYSMSADGRFFLFQSSAQIPQNSEQIPFGQPPFIYLYDREIEKLQQIPIQGINTTMEISADAMSFRLGNTIYPLSRYAQLSTITITNEGSLTIEFQGLPVGYKQFIGVENPQGEIIIHSSATNAQIFNGNNFIPWQDRTDSLVLNITQNQPRGRYRVYLITLPETIDPQNNPDQWQIGQSFFDVR